MTLSPPSAPGLANWLRVIALSVIWGASFMSVKLALAGFGPLTIAASRITLAAATLYLVARIMGMALPTSRRVWAYAVAMGLFSNVLPFALLSWGQIHVASGFAGITMAAVPLFTMVLAHHLLPGERVTLVKLGGFTLGITGVIILIGPRALLASGADVENLARLACIAATLSYAIGGVLTRRCPPVPLVAFSAAALIAASMMALPLALAVEGWPDLAAAPAAAAVAVIYLGLAPTALATLLLVKVIKTAGPTFLTMSNYQVPVWSVIFGTVFMAEKLPAQFLLALAFILAGLAIGGAGRRRAA